MALPLQFKTSFLPLEINFLAENELITILPRVSMKSVELIGTNLPNLNAMRRQEIPLWLALILKAQDKCQIIPPIWLNVAYLKARYDEELEFPNRFSSLPWHWLELSKMLLTKASDDLTDAPHLIRSIIQDLREVRLVKSRKGLKELNEAYLQLDNLSLMEINEIRPYVAEVMDELKKLSDCVKKDDSMDMETNDYEEDENY
ncbi:hypothetical protein BABINDRAFT_40513 [Babjeviella inositovora NRRL Y-12698]|uniref:DNA replication complex GINS protein PSF2 n=1 Tax=Babjeviella inositovora NRRL Y-12698 TaxID=984486 RepID=A0A1E3QK06_9ASCO|nr:uncharacterized protein BABINDRAFT_40513 [Babjeviella inositovora NRRL Y-12698]ODQ78023.1 hypothetical protein BABINDRAFT_40513 [Babjeviella inositovora NRRL Y-12698]